jgi:hypothetical protein
MNTVTQIIISDFAAVRASGREKEPLGVKSAIRQAFVTWIAKGSKGALRH